MIAIAPAATVVVHLAFISGSFHFGFDLFQTICAMALLTGQ
jgi:hypothetical protein